MTSYIFPVLSLVCGALTQLNFLSPQVHFEEHGEQAGVRPARCRVLAGYDGS